MKKGITPVIAMILLLLIVVSLAGGFMIWINSTWGTLQNRATEDITTQIQQQQKKIRIENCDINNEQVVIRNMGSADINATLVGGSPQDLTIYYNGALVTNPTITPAIIPPNTIATVDLSVAGYNLVTGDKVRIVAPANEDVVTC
ncbi:MAG: hypothetical protein DRP11_02485 [Candidatus Aenigmatarchaeota archaeon]|nr:MAG: hypothetical protein DRP11_02485 [Candidatus Aenigmarchaeota archaeon]